jgi:hypothetical protein
MRYGEVIRGTRPALPGDVLIAVRTALEGTPVVRAYLQQYRWTEEARAPSETLDLALELDYPPAGDDGLPPGLSGLLEIVMAALGETSSEVDVSIPSAVALAGMRKHAVLIYERKDL